MFSTWATTPDASIPPALLAHLQRDTARRLGRTDRPQLQALKTLRNPYSDVHVLGFEHGGLQRRVYVKVPHTGPRSGDVAQRRLQSEFDMLQRLQHLQGLDASAGAERGYGTVEPLNLYPEFPALATFEAAPTTLREHYRRGARRLFVSAARDSLVTSVTHCGQWLRAFQQATDAGCGAFPLQTLLDYLDVRLSLLVRVPGLGFTETLAQDVRTRVRRLAEALPPDTHRLCERHYDFASHNILAREGRIWVIDFSMVDTGSFAHDPAFFWLDLEMLKADPSYHTSFISELQDHFLNAYGGITPDHPAFALVRCQYQLNRIVTLHTPSRLPTPGALYRRRVLRQCLGGVRALAEG